MKLFSSLGHHAAVLFLLALPWAARAQTGVTIGAATAPDASAALEIVSSTKGVLLPRVASAAAIANPAPGLLVYQTGAPAGFYYNSNTAASPIWRQIGTTANGDNLGNHTATQHLNLGTNALVGNGGTTGVHITNGGNVGVGTAAPVTQLANSADNVIGTDGNGVSSQALNWVSATTGYAAGLANTNAAANGHGLALKVASANAGTAALDISQGTLASPGTSLLRVRGDGRVGIGTTSPTQKLDVEGGILARGSGSISNQGAYLQWNRTGGDGETWLLNQRGGGPGSIRFGSATTGNATTEWARFTGDGNLGIGTSSPAARLTVQPTTDAEVGLRVTNGVADGSATSGNIVLQTLVGGNSGFSFLGFNGYNATAETRYNTSKNRWRLGTDQRGGGDLFFLDTWNGSTGTPVLAATTDGNVGIGTNAPGSTLTVSGSVAAAYASKTAAYSLTADDYFVSYNGSNSAGFTLPVAVAGAGNFKGRVYKIRNNSAQELIIAALNGENISGNTAIVLAAGHAAELISTGASSGITWELVSSGPLTYTSDAIRGALATGGCANCDDYDVAAANTWVSISAAEYGALQALAGMGTYGTANITATPPTKLNVAATYTQNFSTQTSLPAATYPVALAFHNSPNSLPATMAGLKLKLSTTSQTSGYADWPAGVVTPEGPLPLAVNTVYYYVLKRPTNLTSAAANLAFYSPAPNQVGAIGGSGGTAYTTFNADTSSPNSAFSNTLFFQVLATPTKQW